MPLVRRENVPTEKTFFEGELEIVNPLNRGSQVPDWCRWRRPSRSGRASRIRLMSPLRDDRVALEDRVRLAAGQGHRQTLGNARCDGIRTRRKRGGLTFRRRLTLTMID